MTVGRVALGCPKPRFFSGKSQRLRLDGAALLLAAALSDIARSSSLTRVANGSGLPTKPFTKFISVGLNVKRLVGNLPTGFGFQQNEVIDEGGAAVDQRDLGAGSRACNVNGVNRAPARGLVSRQRALEALAVGVQLLRGQRAFAHAFDVRRVHESFTHELRVVAGMAAHVVFQRLAHRLFLEVIGQALLRPGGWGGVLAHGLGLFGFKYSRGSAGTTARPLAAEQRSSGRCAVAATKRMGRWKSRHRHPPSFFMDGQRSESEIN